MTWRDADAYPVERRQVWRVGRHTFCCSDVVLDRLLTDVLAEADPPTFIYSDPPWNDGQAKSFRTLGKLPPPEYPFRQVYEAIIRLWRREPRTIDLWLVTDRAASSWLTERLSRETFNRRRWRLNDFTNRGVVGILHGASKFGLGDRAELSNLSDEELPAALLDLYIDPGTVLDPCGGLGILSRRAEEAGWTCVSNELDPQRTSAAIRRMEKLTGIAPERVA